MARPSKVEKLDPDLRDLIGRLKERGRSLDEIMEQLRPLDADVSRSGLHRYLKSQSVMGDRLRRTKAIADVVVRRYEEAGSKVPEAILANIEVGLFEFLEAQALAAVDAEDATGDDAAPAPGPKDMAAAALAAQRIAKARHLNLEFVQRIEARVAERTRQEAAKAVEAVGKERGISAELREAVKARILGVTTGGPPA